MATRTEPESVGAPEDLIREQGLTGKVEFQGVAHCVSPRGGSGGVGAPEYRFKCHHPRCGRVWFEASTQLQSGRDLGGKLGCPRPHPAAKRSDPLVVVNVDQRTGTRWYTRYDTPAGDVPLRWKVCVIGNHTHIEAKAGDKLCFHQTLPAALVPRNGTELRDYLYQRHNEDEAIAAARAAS